MFSAHFSVLLQNSFENVLVDFCSVLKWGNPKSKMADTRRLPFDSLDVIRRHMMSSQPTLGLKGESMDVLFVFQVILS